jgi:hypothetical protein
MTCAFDRLSACEVSVYRSVYANVYLVCIIITRIQVNLRIPMSVCDACSSINAVVDIFVSRSILVHGAAFLM